MAKFLFIYRRDAEGASQMTPEEMQQNMSKWHEWIGKGLREGWMVARGDPLTPEGRVVKAKKVVLDGPFAESKEVVGGYSIIDSHTIDDAVALAKGCPGLLTGGSVEVRPIADFPTEK